MEDSTRNIVTTVEEYRKAKVEHYLDQARENVAMGRLLAARKRLAQVLAIAENEQEAIALKREVEGSLADLSARAKNGSSGEHKDTPAGKHVRGELVLLVDQDERLLESLAGTFRRYGFPVVGATSYEEAIETIALAPPRVIISEINFDSGPRGFDLFLWAKTQGASYDPLFFFLATRIDREAVIAGKRFGVEDLIPKPVDHEVVLTSVLSSLSRQRPPSGPA
jgi:CheY-like chemotaxis protein